MECSAPRLRPERRQHVFFRGDPPIPRETEQDSFALSHGPAPLGEGIWQEGEAGRAPKLLSLLTLLLVRLPSPFTAPALLVLLLWSERSHHPPGLKDFNPVPVYYRPSPAYNPKRFLSLFIHAPNRFRQS